MIGNGRALFILLVGSIAPPAWPRQDQPPQAPPVAAVVPDDLPQFIAEIRRQIADDRRRPEDRAQIAQEGAEAFDRAARRAATVEGQVARWSEAVALLDEFPAAGVPPSLIDGLALQAAVYRWAIGHAWLGQSRQLPGDDRIRKAAVEALEDAVTRLRPLWSRSRETPQEPLAQNARFRLAEAILDRVALEPHDEPGLGDLRRQALQALDPLPEQPALASFARLLRARLLTGERQFDLAAQAIDSIPPSTEAGPTETERLDARLDLLLAQHRFADAEQAVRGATAIPDSARDLRSIRVLAARWINLFPGQERRQIEADAFRLASALQRANAPEARLALVELAASILEPDTKDDPAVYDLLAEGHLARGNTQRACDLNLKAAEVATAHDRPGDAWKSSFRAGAILFRAGDSARAARVLGPVASAARELADWAPADQRAKASLLDAICLGRLAAAGDPRALKRQEEALAAHIASFPDDSTTQEARFTLAGLGAGRGDEAAARRLWNEIPAGTPRWLPSRLAVAESWRRDVERLRGEGNSNEATVALASARHSLESFDAETHDPDARTELAIARAELELIPGVGDVKDALQRTETVVRTETHADRRDRARLLWIAALAMSGRYVDAESEARASFERSTPRQLLDLAGRLDTTAARSGDELVRRRLGYLNRIIAGDVLDRGDELDPPTKAEAALRLGRGQLSTGDLDGARRTFAGLEPDLSTVPTELVEPWASALMELGLFGEAVDAYRVLGKRFPPGTPMWLQSRYGLSLAYFRSGKPDDARRLIEGTMALHPSLGGGDLRESFLNLKRRLDRP